jgi:hypothetical protein
MASVGEPPRVLMQVEEEQSTGTRLPHTRQSAKKRQHQIINRTEHMNQRCFYLGRINKEQNTAIALQVWIAFISMRAVANILGRFSNRRTHVAAHAGVGRGLRFHLPAHLFPYDSVEN